MSYGYDHRIPLTLISNIIDKYLYGCDEIYFPTQKLFKSL